MFDPQCNKSKPNQWRGGWRTQTIVANFQELENVSQRYRFAGQWWSMTLIPALRRQRQAHLCEFKASLLYRASTRTARATLRNPVSKTKQNKNKKEEKYRSLNTNGSESQSIS